MSEISRPEYVARASFFGGGCSIVRPSWLGRFFKWFAGLNKVELIAKVTKLAATPIANEKDVRNLAQWTTALKVLHGDDGDAKKAIKLAEDLFSKSQVASHAPEKIQKNIRERLVDCAAKSLLHGQTVTMLQQEYGKLYPVALGDVNRAINEAFHRAITVPGPHWENLYMPQLRITLQEWASAAPTSYTSSKQLEREGRLLGRIPDALFRQIAEQKFACFQSVMNRPRSFQLSRVWALESHQKASFSKSFPHPQKREMQAAFDSFPDSLAVASSFAPRDIPSLSIGGVKQEAAKEGSELSDSGKLVETYQLFKKMCVHCEALGCKTPASMVGQMLTISAIDYHPVAVLKAYGSEFLNLEGTGNITLRSPASGIDRKFFFDAQRNVLVCEDVRVLVQVDAQLRSVKEWELSRRMELAPDADIVKNGWMETIAVKSYNP